MSRLAGSLVAAGISKSYGAEVVLADVSFVVPPRARIGLVDVLGVSGREEAERLARAIAGGSGASHRTLKRGIRLAAAGTGSDEGQDKEFDDLIGTTEFAERLAAARRR